MDDRDIGLLEDIVRHAEEAMRYMAGVSAAAYAKDRRLQLVTERLLEIIGEAAAALSEQTRDQIEYDWRGVRGLRNVIAHQYGSIAHPRIHQVVVARLPSLVQVVREHLER